MPHDIPLATYRIQFTKDFGFDAAAAVVTYLKQLGITHLYASPFLKARPGSTHGYDTIDHNEFNPELGGEEGFERLSKALAEADIGLILDFVPNHMGIGQADNAWWLDVLEWGPRSPHARAFDIEWDTLPYKPEGGVLLPILGKPYGAALESGEIKLTFDPAEGSFSAWYFQHRLPIRPNRYRDILHTVVNAANAAGEPAARALLEIADRHVGPGAPTRDEAPQMKAALAAVSGGAEVIERGLRAYQPESGDPAAVIALHRLLERQHYRVAFWRVAFSEINYRRFFDVNDLAGMRIEDLPTFTSAHRLVVRLVADRKLHGIRLDHIDGLSNPVQYCRRLQRVVRTAGHKRGPFYTVVEKILGEGETMPRFPGVAGTTGYEWLNVIMRTLLDGAGMPALTKAAERFTGRTQPFEQALEDAKRRVLETMLASEFTVLARLLARIAAGHWQTRDYTLDSLRAALELYVLKFPVYRTYVTPDGASPADREMIDKTLAAARAEWFSSDAEIFDFLRDALTLDLIGADRRGYSRARVLRFAMKLQQFTGPMMAKSLEDTTFYRYFSLLALNEVGGDPILPAIGAADFHSQMQERLGSFASGMTATATHDTKRGEDARARILTLAEMPDTWTQEVEGWIALNAGLVKTSAGKRAPSRGHEYMLYQALLGAWPLKGPDDAFVERMIGYAIKAAREGKLETSWTNPDEQYEKGLTDFVRAALDRSRSSEFVASFDGFVKRVSLYGALNSLAQLTLKATMPGVPDFYQGTEYWDYSLVDPDNRRPVDFDARTRALKQIGDTPDWQELAAAWQDARIKLALTRRLLALRNRHPRVFTRGEYRPLAVSGRDADRVIAFARSDGRSTVCVVVGRFFAKQVHDAAAWPKFAEWDFEVDLPGTGFRDALGDSKSLGGKAKASEIFGPLPIAVFESERTMAPRRRDHAQAIPA
ncbi:MAG: (1-_4)-alpha-D-glucan 1-alpha-D-glucosylmutase [Variibacter sp.]|nr:(1->4)-alpha-D-glucan 1-alpha-D-glucosylmutase [Variibacter sp.]